MIVCLVFGCRYTGIECRRRAAVEVLWPMDRAEDVGEGQPGGGFLSLRYKTKEADGG